MSTIFVGGSRHVSRLSSQVKARLDNVMNKGHDVVVGDANGADKAVQKLLQEANYPKVTVFCSGPRPRNNLGHWNVHNVTPPATAKGFQFYAAKDREMARLADFGLMIWDGKSPGTVLNVLRLVRAGKPSVLVNGAQPPLTIKSAPEWDAFLAGSSDELRADLRSRATADEWQPVAVDTQTTLFDPPSVPARGAVAESAVAASVQEVGAPPAAPAAAAAINATALRGGSKYSQLSKDELVRLLTRRDTERQLGLVWERDDIDADAAINDDYVALDLDPSLSHGQAPWRNLIIEGDNYDALRALRMSHAGAIRCIYIDPPYNTGNRDFVYNDRFIDKSHRFRHSLWLEFMYKRLRLAKDLLADDGVIFVSIDDNELFRLGMLMDEVFGEGNFIANVIWQKTYAPKNSALHFSTEHEYVISYARDATNWRPNHLPRTAEHDNGFSNPDNDPRGPWTSGPIQARNFYGAGTYRIETPSGRVIEGPPPGNYWRYSKNKFDELDRDSRIWWGAAGNNVPRLKRFLAEVRQGVVPQTIWGFSEVGHTADAKKQLQEVLQFTSSEDLFSTPKPVQLMERILRIASNPGDTILDFFAGSGTLAQAVAKLNTEDGGDRRFILVSSTEATSEQPDKNLCRDVCAERVRRVMGGYTNSKGDEVPGLGGSFAYLRARRIPPHRLSLKLDHAEVWHALQLLHDHPLSPWPNGGFAADGALAYLADFHPAHVARLRDWLTGTAADTCAGATIYCWAPDRVRELAPQADWQPIPQALRARFGR